MRNGNCVGKLLFLLNGWGFGGHQCDHAFSALRGFFRVLFGVLASVHAVWRFKGVGGIGGAQYEGVDGAFTIKVAVEIDVGLFDFVLLAVGGDRLRCGFYGFIGYFSGSQNDILALAGAVDQTDLLAAGGGEMLGGYGGVERALDSLR